MKNTVQSVYEQRGVSSSKKDVHQATKDLNKGLYPGAFCKIMPDVLAGSSQHCNILHPDTAGTKAGLAYLVWEVTHDLRAVRGIAIDALVMNLDDAGCVGAVDGFLVDQTISRNAFLIPTEVVHAIIESADDFCGWLRNLGIKCYFASGETASVGDLARTLDVGSSVAVRMKRKDVVDASRMAPGNILVGFSSTGMASYENRENSGIGSNGLTNARHDTLCSDYRKYRETYAPQLKKKLVYRGKYKVGDQLPQDKRFLIWEALLSPTRTYLPLIRLILANVNRRYITGIIHCSGGGQTKIINFGQKGNTYVKYNMFPVPPVFEMIQEASGASWREMYEVFNMGHRLEMAVTDTKVARDIIALSRSKNIETQRVGEIIARATPEQHNSVVIESPQGAFRYPE